MSERDDGGPAFPMPASEHSQGGHFEQHGMSLRDWFAGQALAGLLANQWANQTFTGTYTNAAPEAYSIADAMLAARTRKEPT